MDDKGKIKQESLTTQNMKWLSSPGAVGIEFQSAEIEHRVSNNTRQLPLTICNYKENQE